MDHFKLTAWNIENSNDLLTALASDKAEVRRKAEARAAAIAEEITAIAPDILLVSEGPQGETRAKALFDIVAPDHRLVTRGAADPNDYGIKGGQWMWFLIRTAAPIEGRLQNLDRWRRLTEAASEGETRGGVWQVSYPLFDAATRTLGFSVPQRHGHFRHPQVLHVTIAGRHAEVIGCHLKSKINKIRHSDDAYAPDFFERNPELVAGIVQSRVKLTTECADIRHYIQSRFAEDPDVPIIVAGDLNDGPGKERIERRFLYHDLVGTLQGDVFLSQQFLNHALFDFPDSASWSYDLGRDALDPDRSPRILLDHIMFTQSLSGADRPGAFAYRARAKGGLVEHDVHHRVAAGHFRYAETSDHRPVSMVFDHRPDIPPSG